MLKIVYINIELVMPNYARKVAENIASIANAEIIYTLAHDGCIILATEENAEKICNLFEDRNPYDVDMYSVNIYEGGKLIRKEFHVKTGADASDDHPYVKIFTNGKWEYHAADYEEENKFMETLEAYVHDNNAEITDVM